MRRDHTLVTDDPLGLVRALDSSGRFQRDSRLGGILHRGKVSCREVSPTDSLHVIVDGNHVSAHVDPISPLSAAGGGGPSPTYPLSRVLAHNLAGLAGDLSRRLGGVHSHQRCNLDCEVVWVDDGSAMPLEPAFEPTPPADPVPAERVPFSPIDEAIHLLDTEAAPWSVQLEVRVAGALDEHRLRAALGQAFAIHPMARARKVASRRTAHRDTWAIPERPEVDPLRVIDCPDDASLAVARAELQSLAVPLAESPPLRVRLARHPAGDVLMMNVNHAAMDGLGALRFLQSTARAYARTPDVAPLVGFFEARELPARLTDTDVTRKVRRYLALAEKLSDLVAPPARIAADGDRDEPGYGFQQVSLSVSATTSLLDGDRRRGGTVNDVLVAALHLAISRWNADHGARCSRIGVLVPANLRPRRWRHDAVGNYSLPARISTTRRSRNDPRWALDAVVAQTRRKKRTGMGTALIEVVGRSRLLPLWAKEAMVAALPLTGNRLVDTAMLSNLGLVTDQPSFGAGDGPGDVVELWFSPPARMPLGLSVGAATVDGRLFLSFRYRHRLFDPDAAARFVDIYLDALAGLVCD